MKTDDTEKTDIYIIGSGAIGKALAVFLKLNNKNVTLVRGSVDHLPEFKKKITVIGDGETFEQEITTSTFSNISVINGVVLVATKTFANMYIAEKLAAIRGSFLVVLLQNGLNIERPFNNFRNTFRCVLFSTSQVTGDNEVSFKTVSASPIGSAKGNNKRLKDLINEISTPQFEFRSEPNIVEYVWKKTIVNCVFNTICPLLEVDNGIFYRDPGAKNLARDIIGECVMLAREKNVSLDESEILENLVLISQKSNGQLISTYMDILSKRKTEIESLNLEMARISDEIGQSDLLEKTRLLGQLVQIKSNTVMKSLTVKY